MVPSASLDLYVNNTKFDETANVPANIQNGNLQFRIGRNSGGDNYLDGQVSMCFLCSSALPEYLLTALFEQGRILYDV